jgi:hypothetical protein
VTAWLKAVRSKTIHETSVSSRLNDRGSGILPHRKLKAKEDFLEIAVVMSASLVRLNLKLEWRSAGDACALQGALDAVVSY